MSYCFKHAENFHTQTCRRCDDESAIAAKDAEIARLNNKLNTDSQNLQIECQKAEIAALREQRDNAQIAVAMKQGEIADLSDQIAALRERCGRLAKLYKARDKYEEAMSNHARLSGRVTQDERIERHLAFIAAKTACEAHDDLAPAAKEKTDGA